MWWMSTRGPLEQDTCRDYVLPRLSVDGTEWYFDTPQMIRSTPLMWPAPEEPEGLRPEDINGDGKILLMRIKHPEGEWKVSEKDARLMVRRRPEDREGTFYKIHTEGTIKRRTESGELEPFYDGRPITGDPGGPFARSPSFDFNRNYPVNWAMEHRQPGAGPYPDPREVGSCGPRTTHPNPALWGARPLVDEPAPPVAMDGRPFAPLLAPNPGSHPKTPTGKSFRRPPAGRILLFG